MVTFQQTYVLEDTTYAYSAQQTSAGSPAPDILLLTTAYKTGMALGCT